MESKVEEIYKGIGIITEAEKKSSGKGNRKLRRNNMEWKNRQFEPVSTLYRNKV